MRKEERNNSRPFIIHQTQLPYPDLIVPILITPELSTESHEPPAINLSLPHSLIILILPIRFLKLPPPSLIGRYPPPHPHGRLILTDAMIRLQHTTQYHAGHLYVSEFSPSVPINHHLHPFHMFSFHYASIYIAHRLRPHMQSKAKHQTTQTKNNTNKQGEKKNKKKQRKEENRKE